MKNFLLAFLFSCLCFSAYSTTWTVTNSGTTFVPADITINLGDSVNFSIQNAHTVVEVSYTTWLANGNTPLAGGFSLPNGGGMLYPAQLPTGIHYYVCGPHAANGMKGTITVQNCTVPAKPGTITGNATVCSGSGNAYNISAVTGATSYTWTLPAGWSGSSTTTSINTIAGATSGSVTVTANNACGSSPAQTKSVTVTTTTATPGSISGSTAVCTATSNTYSISAVAGATSYTWTLPAGWTGSSTTTSINTTAGTASGNITVSANNTCGSSSAQTLAVSVSTSIPATPGTISGNTTVCSASSNVYSVSVVAGAASYIWTLPSGWTGSSTTNSISAVAGSTGGNITVKANNACGSSSAQTLAVTVSGGSAPAQPAAISGLATVCSGTTNNYSISAVANATSYTWTLPAGWSGSSTTTSINAAAGATGGTISVTANNACGSSAARTKSVTVQVIPAQPGAISGNATVCAWSTNVYSVAAVTGATSYTWILPSGWSGTSTTTSITATAGATGGKISVTANNVCGNSPKKTLSVMVNAVNVSVSQLGATLSANETGATYQWRNCDNGLNIPGDTNQSFTAFFNGNYSVIISKYGCTDTSDCYPVSTAVPKTLIPMPDTLSGANIYLTLDEGTRQFFSGYNTNTIGYNGSYLGPVIFLTKGQNVSMHVTNNLEDTTTTHWHGLHVAPVNDGGPHTPIPPGTTWNPSFTVYDNAATYFYHPHMHGMTMTQVVKGAAGMIIVRDAVEAALTLPRTYGVDDIPLVCQFKHLDSTTKEIILDDMLDNIYMVNGTLNPMVNVPAQVVRFRLLNGSSSRILEFGFNDGRTFYQITSDDGLLNSKVPLTRLRLGSGERAEILVNFSGQQGSTFFINQYGNELPAGFPGGPSMMGDPIGPYDNITFSFLQINVVAPTPSPITTMPSTLTTNSPWDTTGAKTMTFNLEGIPSTSTTNFAINGVQFNMDTINFTVKKNDLMIWKVTNLSMMAHPFHVHGNHFYILSYNDSTPPANMQGRKDMVLLKPIEGSATLIMKFEDFSDSKIPYMYHCHILSHEDGGMMGQFLVVPCTPSKPGAISGPTIGLCPAGIASATYTISSVKNAVSYNWTPPAGVIVTAGQGTTSATVSFGAGFTTGNISVTASNSCGTSAARTLLLNSVPPKPAAITGNTAVCAGSVNIYSIPAVTGTTSYAWVLPAGWTGSSTTTSINATAGANSGYVKVKANNVCGSSAYRKLLVSVTCTTLPGGVSSQPLNNEFHRITAVPNPFTNELLVSGTSANGTLSLYDVAGKLIVNKRANANETILDASEITAGVYFLVYTDPNRTENLKVVKE